MIHDVSNSPDGAVFVGDLLNQTYQSYDELTGKLRWSTDLSGSGTPPGGPSSEGSIHQPRGGGVWWNGKVIEAEGRNIRTFDPDTGAILNDFTDPGYFADWGITSPVIVGNEMYLGSISGWVFAAPASYITTNPGTALQPFPPSSLTTPPLPPIYSNPSAAPTSAQQEGFPATCLASAGGQDHNSVVSSSLGGLSWQTALADALPLNAPPRDVDIFGPEVATEMTDLAYGAGSGVCAANGILYAGTDRYTINAINASTGQVIWTFQTINSDYGQPLLTPNTVVVSSGDEWFNFAQVQNFAANSPTLHLGASFQNLHGLDPNTGQEKWTFYTQGTDAMTPLYDNGNLYWVNGSGNVRAINADTGATFAPFEDSSGNPTLHIGGMNAIDSANIYHQPGGDDIMVVGTAKPNVFYGIDLATDSVLWKQTLPAFTTLYTGFAASSPVVDQNKGLVIDSVLVNASGSSVTSEAFALNAKTGAVVWTQSLGSGSIPYGFTAASPVLDGNQAFFADPVTQAEVALNSLTGAVVWSTPLGQMSKAPGTVVGSDLIQPAGPDLYTLNTSTGAILNKLAVGGSFKDNAASVVGGTLFIGNGWGWAMALPLSTVTGQH
jgi:outer membrane protein assembly factor BamB